MKDLQLFLKSNIYAPGSKPKWKWAWTKPKEQKKTPQAQAQAQAQAQTQAQKTSDTHLVQSQNAHQHHQTLPHKSNTTHSTNHPNLNMTGKRIKNRMEPKSKSDDFQHNDKNTIQLHNTNNNPRAPIPNRQQSSDAALPHNYTHTSNPNNTSALSNNPPNNGNVYPPIYNLSDVDSLTSSHIVQNHFTHTIRNQGNLPKMHNQKIDYFDNNFIKQYYQPVDHYDRTLSFESRFESGNLNVAIKVSSTQYDLVLLNDTNTKGNTQCKIQITFIFK